VRIENDDADPFEPEKHVLWDARAGHTANPMDGKPQAVTEKSLKLGVVAKNGDAQDLVSRWNVRGR